MSDRIFELACELAKARVEYEIEHLEGPDVNEVAEEIFEEAVDKTFDELHPY